MVHDLKGKFSFQFFFSFVDKFQFFFDKFSVVNYLAAVSTDQMVMMVGFVSWPEFISILTVADGNRMNQSGAG
jgi:hypothetical protein